MWRAARASEDEAIVKMCGALYEEDPAPAPVGAAYVRRTLERFREEPHRGRAIVCERDGRAVGYALLATFWSNELGGEVCVIDELYVAKDHRGRGLATSLFERLAEGDSSLWSDRPVALLLEVTAKNDRARSLYERLGFRGKNLSLRLPLARRE